MKYVLFNMNSFDYLYEWAYDEFLLVSDCPEIGSIISNEWFQRFLLLMQQNQWLVYKKTGYYRKYASYFHQLEQLFQMNKKIKVFASRIEVFRFLEHLQTKRVSKGSPIYFTSYQIQRLKEF